MFVGSQHILSIGGVYAPLSLTNDRIKKGARVRVLLCFLWKGSMMTCTIDLVLPKRFKVEQDCIHFVLMRSSRIYYERTQDRMYVIVFTIFLQPFFLCSKFWNTTKRRGEEIEGDKRT